MEWGKRIIAARKLANKTVLEVGSVNVNGSLRELFTGPYLGVDLRPGPASMWSSTANICRMTKARSTW